MKTINKKTTAQKTTKKEVVQEVKPKSKIALYWESRGNSKGEIVNMRAVLR